MKNKNKIKLNKNPYKGILTEVANEEGSSPQAIWNAVNITKNLRIIEIVSRKVKERSRRLAQSQRELEVC